MYSFDLDAFGHVGGASLEFQENKEYNKSLKSITQFFFLPADELEAYEIISHSISFTIDVHALCHHTVLLDREQTKNYAYAY